MLCADDFKGLDTLQFFLTRSSWWDGHKGPAGLMSDADLLSDVGVSQERTPCHPQGSLLIDISSSLAASCVCKDRCREMHA